MNAHELGLSLNEIENFSRTYTRFLGRAYVISMIAKAMCEQDFRQPTTKYAFHNNLHSIFEFRWDEKEVVFDTANKETDEIEEHYILPMELFMIPHIAEEDAVRELLQAEEKEYLANARLRRTEFQTLEESLYT